MLKKGLHVVNTVSSNGWTVDSSKFVGVNSAIKLDFALQQSNVIIRNTHVNGSDVGIHIKNAASPLISNNLMYNDAPYDTYKDILVEDTVSSLVEHNIFRNAKTTSNTNRRAIQVVDNSVNSYGPAITGNMFDNEGYGIDITSSNTWLTSIKGNHFFDTSPGDLIYLLDLGVGTVYQNNVNENNQVF